MHLILPLQLSRFNLINHISDRLVLGLFVNDDREIIPIFTRYHNKDR